ncbi:MarR family winged helix-turn-helix transcriptional regulator [Gordonia sp. NPDC003376]
MSSYSDLLCSLVLAGQRLTRVAVRETAEKVSPNVYLTLATLTDHGPLRTGELAVHVRLTQPAMTRLLATMADDGWVRRVADSDARAARFAITDEGTALQADWHRRIGEALEPYFRDLPDDDVAAIARTVTLLDAAPLDGPPPR